MKDYSGIIYEKDAYYGHQDLSVPYFINCCGYMKATGIDFFLKRRRCDFYLIYLINGIGHYKMEIGTLSVDAGNIIIYRPWEEQDYYYLGNENAELYWIHFTGSHAEDLLSSLFEPKQRIYRVGINAEFIEIFESIIHESQIKKPGYHQVCIGLFIQLLSLFSRKISLLENEDKISKSMHIENIIKIMHKEYQQNHPIEYYAEIANLSVYQFIRNFKKVTKLSPAKYIEKIRILKAKELLVDTDLTINEISDLIGYNDPFYFSRVFKKETNTTPTLFRNINTNT